MTFTHVVLTITEWIGSYGSRYFCTYFYDNGKCHESRKLSIEEARTLQWELVKKGATKTCSYNPYAPHVYTREIRLLEVN